MILPLLPWSEYESRARDMHGQGKKAGTRRTK